MEGNDISNVYVTSNVFNGIGTSGRTAWSVLMQWAISPGGSGLPTINNFNFINNTVYAGNGGATQGLGLPDIGIARNITVRNNIIQGFSNSAVYSDLSGSETIDYLSLENNILYGNGINSHSHNGNPVTHNTTQNNRIANPTFVTPGSNFHLSAGSPGIGTGIAVGLATDIEGNAYLTPPGIGAYEYNSSPPETAIPVYVSSVVENITPNILEITFSLSLANSVPDASAFNVMINSLSRSINTVTVSGKNVVLVLTSPVVYGDVITITYTKPSYNPLQTTTGGQAASFTVQPVTNMVTSVGDKTGYQSSVVENSTPDIIEISFSLNLANVVPNLGAFAVEANLGLRTIKSITISGKKVLLTLENPIVYGDILTVTYVKPPNDYLQTSSGGYAYNFVKQPVTNNVAQIKDLYGIVMHIYPNPANGDFSISISGDPTLENIGTSNI